MRTAADGGGVRKNELPAMIQIDTNNTVGIARHQKNLMGGGVILLKEGLLPKGLVDGFRLKRIVMVWFFIFMADEVWFLYMMLTTMSI